MLKIFWCWRGGCSWHFRNWSPGPVCFLLLLMNKQLELIYWFKLPMIYCVMESGQDFLPVLHLMEPQTQRIWFCLSTNGESWTSFSCYMEKDVFYVLYFWHRYNVCMFNYFWYHTCQRWKERYLEELLLRNFFVFLQNYIFPTCILREWMVVGIYNSLND